VKKFTEAVEGYTFQEEDGIGTRLIRHLEHLMIWETIKDHLEGPECYSDL
jgi:hypothetical protein